MRIAQLLRSVPRVANIVAGASLALLVLKALILNQMPGAFAGAQELGALADSILTSIVASYIFFVMVVHLPSARDRLLVRPHVARHANQVVQFCRQQLNALGNATSTTLDFDSLSPDELHAAFLATNPNSPAPMVFFPGNQTATWIQYLEHHVERSVTSISRTLSNAQFIEARLVQLLTSIEDSSYFLQMRLVGSAPLRNTDLSVWAKSFIEYCVRCKELEAYCTEALVPNVP